MEPKSCSTCSHFNVCKFATPLTGTLKRHQKVLKPGNYVSLVVAIREEIARRCIYYKA